MTKAPRSRPVFLVAAAALALAAPALADAPCADDIQRLCQGIPPGGGRIFACLQSNANNLSDDCRATLNDARQMAYQVSLDCQADVFSWCQGIARGEGRILACLMSHLGDLSSTCHDAIAQMQQFQAVCSNDVAQLCAGVAAGGGKILACLLAQKDQLSGGCRAFLGR